MHHSEISQNIDIRRGGEANEGGRRGKKQGRGGVRGKGEKEDRKGDLAKVREGEETQKSGEAREAGN